MQFKRNIFIPKTYFSKAKNQKKRKLEELTNKLEESNKKLKRITDTLETSKVPIHFNTYS